jgi:hypothetical protein
MGIRRGTATQDIVRCTRGPVIGQGRAAAPRNRYAGRHVLPAVGGAHHQIAVHRHAVEKARLAFDADTAFAGGRHVDTGLTQRVEHVFAGRDRDDAPGAGQTHLNEDPGMKAGAIDKHGEDFLAGNLLDVPARRAEPCAFQGRVADAKFLADQMIERDAARSDIAAVLIRGQSDLVVAPQRVQGLGFEQRDLSAFLGPIGVEAFATCVAIALDADAFDQPQA